MRVIHVVNELLIGGGAVHIHQLLKDTIALGHQGACATFQDGPVREWMERDGIPVFMMNRDKDPIISQEALDWKPDVLHGHSCGGGADVCKLRIPGVIIGETIHSVVGGRMVGDFEVVEVEATRRIRPQSTLIRWAFPPDRFVPRRLLGDGWHREKIIIGRVGRLDGSKAPDEFVRCLSKLPKSVGGLLVGDGPEYHNLQQLAHDLGCLDRLTMPGWHSNLPGASVGDWFNQMDIVVYPTHDESVCAGVHEPGFLNLPVVCYPRGGMGETVLHRKTGLHAHSVDELVYWTTYLIENPYTAKGLGKNLREQIRRNGQDDPIREALLHIDLYKTLLK